MRLTYRSTTLALAAAALLTVGAGSTATRAADIEAGQKSFRRCAACHTVEEGKHRAGPSLYGVAGKTAGTAEGFRYSPDMVAFGEGGGTWDTATLDTFLENPRGVVAKTRMAFPGIKDADERANVIAYLESLGQ